MGILAALAFGLRRGDTMLIALGLSGLGTFAFFLLVNGMEHWTLPAYLSAAVACGILGGRLVDALAPRRRPRTAVLIVTTDIFLGSALPAGVVAGSLVAGEALVPVDSCIVQGLVDPTTSGPPLGKEVTEILSTAPYNGPTPTYLVAQSYGTTARAAFYSRGHPRVYGLDHRYALWGGVPLCGRCLIVNLGD